LRAVCRGYIVPAFYKKSTIRLCTREKGGKHTIAHVRRATAIHIGTFDILGWQTEIRQLDNDLALQTPVGSGPNTVCDDKIFRFDITMKNLVSMTRCDGITHLAEHGGNETQASFGQELGRMKIGKQTWGWRCVRRSEGRRVIMIVMVEIVMVARLLEKVKEVLAWDIL
jgi:hypothetical protein